MKDDAAAAGLDDVVVVVVAAVVGWLATARQIRPVCSCLVCKKEKEFNIYGVCAISLVKCH